MSSPSPYETAEKAMARFERIGMRAAMAGIAASVMLGTLKLIIDRVAPASVQLRVSFEAVCTLLWPSAMLLLGAQTVHGQAALFIMAACLNAGYFVIGAMVVAGLLDKVRSQAQVTTARVSGRAYSSPRVTVRRAASTRSLA